MWFWVRKFFGLKAVIDVKSELIAHNEDYDQNTKDRLSFIKKTSFQVKYYFSSIFWCKCFKHFKDKKFLVHERFVKNEISQINNSLTLPRFMENNESIILLNMKLQRDMQQI